MVLRHTETDRMVLRLSETDRMVLRLSETDRMLLHGHDDMFCIYWSMHIQGCTQPRVSHTNARIQSTFTPVHVSCVVHKYVCDTKITAYVL